MAKFRIQKHFIGGLLKGATISETTTVRFQVGFVCTKPVGGSPYEILAVEEVPTVPSVRDRFQASPGAALLAGRFDRSISEGF
jgi:hypothetical protein